MMQPDDNTQPMLHGQDVENPGNYQQLREQLGAIIQRNRTIFRASGIGSLASLAVGIGGGVGGIVGLGSITLGVITIVAGVAISAGLGINSFINYGRMHAHQAQYAQLESDAREAALIQPPAEPAIVISMPEQSSHARIMIAIPQAPSRSPAPAAAVAELETSQPEAAPPAPTVAATTTAAAPSTDTPDNTTQSNPPSPR